MKEDLAALCIAEVALTLQRLTLRRIRSFGFICEGQPPFEHHEDENQRARKRLRLAIYAEN
jgi:dethiobiotin synthetase